MSKGTIIACVSTALAIAGGIGLRQRSNPVAHPSSERIVVVTGDGRRPDLPTAVVGGRHATVPTNGAFEGIERRIALASGIPGVLIKDVRVADDERQIACGCETVPGVAYRRRFVWIGSAGLLATDDGGPDFASLARVCDRPPA